MNIMNTLVRLWLYRSVRETDRRTRRRKARQARRADQRGIALQTVIVLVVLVAVAGAVAAVIMSRASTLTGQFESGDTTASVIDTKQECAASTAFGLTGKWSDGDSSCTWTEAAKGDKTITPAACVMLGGVYAADNPDTCTVG